MIEDDLLMPRPPKYRAAVTLWKAAWTFVYAMTGIGAGVLAVQLPESEEEFRANWLVFVLPIVAALWRALENYRKNYRDDGTPLWEWPWARIVPKAPPVPPASSLLPVLLAVLTLGGCATGMTMLGVEDTWVDAEQIEHQKTFEFKQWSLSTFGSSQQEGHGQATYSGDGWSLGVNGGQIEQKSADPVPGAMDAAGSLMLRGQGAY